MNRDSTYSLAEGTALADGNPVTLLNTESGGDVSSQVLVALLVTVVLGDVVEVFAADDDGAVHLGGDNAAGQDTATDGDHTGEGALLVCEIVSNLVESGLRLKIFGLVGLFRGWRIEILRRLKDRGAFSRLLLCSSVHWHRKSQISTLAIPLTASISTLEERPTKP